MFALLVGAELCARALMAPIGDHVWAYPSASSPAAYEWYRFLSTSGETPPVLAIGDSTGARNFDPEAFSAVSMSGSAYSLARPGNFPLAMRSNTLPLLHVGKAPDVVLLFQWAGSFRDDPRVRQIERGSMSPILDARRNGTALVTDYLHLSRLFPARSFLARYWLQRKPVIQPAGFGSYSPLFRDIDQQPEANVGQSALNVSELEFSEERRDVVRELVRIARARSFLIVAVVGPQYRPDDDKITALHLEWLRDLQASNCGELVVLDARDAVGLENRMFKDNNHLYADGAELFSEHLAAVVDEINLDDRQRNCSRARAQRPQMLRRGA